MDEVAGGVARASCLRGGEGDDALRLEVRDDEKRPGHGVERALQSGIDVPLLRPVLNQPNQIERDLFLPNKLFAMNQILLNGI